MLTKERLTGGDTTVAIPRAESLAKKTSCQSPAEIDLQIDAT
jgi:hypothetical protein